MFWVPDQDDPVAGVPDAYAVAAEGSRRCAPSSTRSADRGPRPRPRTGPTPAGTVPTEEERHDADRPIAPAGCRAPVRRARPAERADRPVLPGVGRQSATADRLGPLADLPGYWEGTGFSLIARPDSDPANEDGFFLQLNLLRESIAVHPDRVAGAEPRQRAAGRRPVRRDLPVAGHRRHDGRRAAHRAGPLPDRAGDHRARVATEHRPAVDHPARQRALRRRPWESVDPTGPMQIPPLNTVPFPTGGPPPPPGTPTPVPRLRPVADRPPYRTAPFRSASPRRWSTTRRRCSGAAPARAADHAPDRAARHDDRRRGEHPVHHGQRDTRTFTSIFAIEHVVGPAGREFLQLQYSQTALLEFRGHVLPARDRRDADQGVLSALDLAPASIASLQSWLVLNVPAPLLLLGIAAGCVALALCGMVVVRRNVEVSELEAHHDVAGFILAVVGVVYAVLLAFIVIIVWEQYDTAEEADTEASLVLALYRDASALDALGARGPAAGRPLRRSGRHGRVAADGGTPHGEPRGQ